jgi:hypothetical protein
MACKTNYKAKIEKKGCPIDRRTIRGGGLYFIFITFLKNVEKYICLKVRGVNYIWPNR